MGMALEVIGLVLSLAVAVWKVVGDTKLTKPTRVTITILVVLGAVVALGSAINREVGAAKARKTAQELYDQIDRLEAKLDDIQRSLDALTQTRPVLLTDPEFGTVTRNVTSIRTTVLQLKANRDLKLIPMSPARLAPLSR